MKLRVMRDVETEDDGQRELTVETGLHAHLGGVATFEPIGHKWSVRWLRGNRFSNADGSGTITVQVTTPGLYRVTSCGSRMRTWDAYLRVREDDGVLHATVLGVDQRVHGAIGPTLAELEEHHGVAAARKARNAHWRKITRYLAESLEAGNVYVALPHVTFTLEGLQVPELDAVSNKQRNFARAVRAIVTHDFFRLMLERSAKLPRAHVEAQLWVLAGWLQGHLRVHTDMSYWLDSRARANPEVGVLGEAYRAASFASVEMGADSMLHIEVEWT